MSAEIVRLRRIGQSATACIEAGLSRVEGSNPDGSERRVPTRLFHDDLREAMKRTTAHVNARPKETNVTRLRPAAATGTGR